MSILVPSHLSAGPFALLPPPCGGIVTVFAGVRESDLVHPSVYRKHL